MNHKRLRIPLLILTLMFTQPQAVRAQEEVLGAAVLVVGVGTLIPSLVLGTASTAVSVKRYWDDPTAHRTTFGYLGAVCGGLAIAAGGVTMGISSDGSGWNASHTYSLATAGMGILNTAISIHSIRRIKKARADQKVTFHGITPTLLGSSEIEGVGLNVSLKF